MRLLNQHYLPRLPGDAIAFQCNQINTGNPAASQITSCLPSSQSPAPSDHTSRPKTSYTATLTFPARSMVKGIVVEELKGLG